MCAQKEDDVEKLRQENKRLRSQLAARMAEQTDAFVYRLPDCFRFDAATQEAVLHFVQGVYQSPHLKEELRIDFERHIKFTFRYKLSENTWQIILVVSVHTFAEHFVLPC